MRKQRLSGTGRDNGRRRSARMKPRWRPAAAAIAARGERLAPASPGVYRMLNAASDVLYVGKAKNVSKRLRPTRASTRRCRRASCA